MVNGHRVMAHHTLPVRVRVLRYRHTARERYVVQAAAVTAERRGLRHGHHELDAFDQRIHVFLLRQIVRYDTRILERIGAPQQDLAPALGPQQHLQQARTTC